MKEVKTGKKYLKWIIGAAVVAALAAVGIVLFFLFGAPKQELNNTKTGKIYWNVDGNTYRAGKDIRYVSSDGYVYMNFAVDGRQERIPVANATLAAAIDMQEMVGLVLDENGVAVDYMRVAEFTGGILAYKYYVTAVDGNRITCNSSATLGGYDVVFELGEETPVYDVGTQGITCGMSGTVKKDDQVIVILGQDGSACCVYTLSYTQPGDVYWNVSRKYDSVARRSTRELDATGCYTYEMLLNGEVVTVRTRDYDIACQMDSYNAPCMGLTFNEDGYVVETTHAKNVTGGAIFGSYARVMKVDGSKLYAKKLTGTGVGAEYSGLLSPDCKIVNTTAVGTRGEYTELRYGDQIHALTDNRGKICYVFVTARVTEGEYDFCWNFGYVSGGTAYRQPDGDGVYHIQLASNGESFTAWTKDEKLVKDLDGSRFRGVKLGQDNEILSVIPANHVYGGSYFCSWYYITEIDGDQLTVTSGGKTPKVLTGTMSENVEVYNTSTRIASHAGEKATLRVGDRIYAQNDMYGQIRAIYIVNRYIHADVYYNLNRKWSNTTNSTTRKPDADGLYSFLMAVNGQQVTVKTASLEVANAIDSQVAKAVGLSFEDGLAVLAYHAKETEDCKGGVGVSYEYVKKISGRQITTYKPSTGKTTTFTISRDANCYNVSSDYESFRGEIAQLRVGDQIHCLKALNGETNYIYITKRGQKETTHTCSQGGDDTVWYEWNGVTAIEQSGHYLLTKDVSRTSRLTIGAGLDVTICLNGHTITSTDRVFSLYGKLTLCDHADSSGNYKGTIISKYSNTVGADGTVTAKVYGGLAYLYNNDSDTELNLYGGNYIHEGSATNGGLIFASATGSSGYSATVNLYDGKLSGGKATGLGGGVYLVNGAAFNMYGGTIENCTSTGNGAGVAVNNGSFTMTGGTIYGCTTTASGGGVNVEKGTFTMTAGSLSGNKANEGGNLRIGKNGSVELKENALLENGSAKNGGNITMFGKLYIFGNAKIIGGTATNYGSAINLFSNYDDAVCLLNMTAGTIEGAIRYDSNKGSVNMELLGGTVGEVIMYDSPVTNLFVGGDVQIGQIHLETGKHMTIYEGGLSGASIGVSVDDTSKPFTTVKATSDAGCFYPVDQDGYELIKTGNDLYLKAKVVAHTAHCACGGTLTGVAQTAHADSCQTVANWTPINKESFAVGGLLKDSSTSGRVNFASDGRYYLEEDVSISSVIEILKGADITICLNGHTLTSTATGNSAIRTSGTLNICDCQGGGKITGKSAKTAGLVYMLTSGADSAGTTLNLYGGSLVMTDKNYTANAGVIQVGNSGSNPGVFNMYGGSISGGTANKGGNILIGTAAATMNMYGGSVTDGEVKTNDNSTDRNRGGNIYVNKGTLNIYGGTVSGGKTTAGDKNPQLGGDIYQAGGMVYINSAVTDLDYANDGTGYLTLGNSFSGNVICASAKTEKVLLATGATEAQAALFRAFDEAAKVVIYEDGKIYLTDKT